LKKGWDQWPQPPEAISLLHRNFPSVEVQGFWYYFTSGACDGFILWPTIFPSMFQDFCRFVVPELRRRGLVRREYSGKTLRENLANPQ